MQHRLATQHPDNGNRVDLSFSCWIRVGLGERAVRHVVCGTAVAEKQLHLRAPLYGTQLALCEGRLK